MGIAIGTSGYGYRDWSGTFYPSDLAREDYLRYYSMFFPFVELDSYYFRMPEAWRLEQAATQVPRDFRFAILAHRTLSSDIEGGWVSYAREFAAALRPRAFRDRLAAVLLQFPKRFRYTDENRVYLGELTRELAEFPLFLEFLGQDWYRAAVVEEAARRRIGLVASDGPESGAKPLPVTSGVGYLRFHGRNVLGSGAEGRAYSYADADLSSWVSPVLAASAASSSVYVSFANRVEAASVQDARRFRDLVEASSP